MEFLGDLLGIGASAASGGLLGLVGSLGGAVAKYFQARQQQAFKRDEWQHETDLLQLQMQAGAQEAEQELAVVAQAGSWQGATESLRADAALAGNTYKWVNASKSLFRPLLTLTLLGLVWLMWRDIVSGEVGVMVQLFTDAELKEILRYQVYSVVFAAVTATVWWFGDRALAPPGMKNR